MAGVVLAGFVALMVWLHDGAAVVPEGEAESAVALVVGRDLDLATAFGLATPWERHLYRWLLLEALDGTAQGLAWLREVAAVSAEPDVDLRLAMLLGEAGRLEEVEELVAAWWDRRPPYRAYAQALAAAYLGEDLDPEDAGLLVGLLGDELGEDTWFHDRLAMLLAGRAGDVAATEAARAARDARGSALLRRVRLLAAADLGTLGAGAVAIVLVALRRRRGAHALRVAGAELPPPWPPGRALAVVLRGGAAAVVVLLVFLLTDVEDDLLRVTTSLAANVAVLPLLLMVRRQLVRPSGRSLALAFGLVPHAGTFPSLVVVTLAVAGVGVLGDWASSALGTALDRTPHWTEWFDGDLVWGSWAVAGVVVLDTCVLAPVVEETVFRGVLFGALRTRMAFGPAALGSGLLFAAAHGYGLIGFGAVLVSGVVWAWAYERTRSLLPGIIAHGANNIAASLAVAMLYRG